MAVQRLKEAAEKAKIELSSSMQVRKFTFNVDIQTRSLYLECTDDEVYQGRNTENSVDTLLGLMYILFNFCIFKKKHVLLLFTFLPGNLL